MEDFGPGSSTQWVFANGAGNPLSSSSFLANHFARAQGVAGLSCRFHDLRHERRTRHRPRAHPKAIQAPMGHSSINVTLDCYCHLFRELDEAIAMAFDQSLNEAMMRRLTPLNDEVDDSWPPGYSTAGGVRWSLSQVAVAVPSHSPAAMARTADSASSIVGRGSQLHPLISTNARELGALPEPQGDDAEASP